MGFAKQLKNARLKLGYTQQQIADIMGITKSTYCGYETGKRRPDVQKIKQLTKILHVSGDVLLETDLESTSEHQKAKELIDSLDKSRLEVLIPFIQYLISHDRDE